MIKKLDCILKLNKKIFENIKGGPLYFICPVSATAKGVKPACKLYAKTKRWS